MNIFILKKKEISKNTCKVFVNDSNVILYIQTYIFHIIIYNVRSSITLLRRVVSLFLLNYIKQI